MLASVRKGGKIDETEIPPPVACGASGGPSRTPAPAASPDQLGECDSAVEISPVSAEAAPVVMDPASNTKDESSGVTSPASLSSPEGEHAASGTALHLGQSSAFVTTYHSSRVTS